MANPNWTKGVSGNPNGRPVGMTLKEYVRQQFLAMTPDQKDKFLDKIPPSEKWRMSEGNPAQDLTSAGEKIQTIPIYAGASTGQNLQEHPSDQTNIQTEQKDKMLCGGDISE